MTAFPEASARGQYKKALRSSFSLTLSLQSSVRLTGAVKIMPTCPGYLQLRGFEWSCRIPRRCLELGDMCKRPNAGKG
uniref:Uncharacterized protein n=1 Tax=Knipowitschia caucasica TaxID=637954 RepID=A0AAV2KYE8_KNICA